MAASLKSANIMATSWLMRPKMAQRSLAPVQLLETCTARQPPIRQRIRLDNIQWQTQPRLHSTRNRVLTAE